MSEDEESDSEEDESESDDEDESESDDELSESDDEESESEEDSGGTYSEESLDDDSDSELESDESDIFCESNRVRQRRREARDPLQNDGEPGRFDDIENAARALTGVAGWSWHCSHGENSFGWLGKNYLRRRDQWLV